MWIIVHCGDSCNSNTKNTPPPICVTPFMNVPQMMDIPIQNIWLCPGWGEIHHGLLLYSFIITFQLKNSGKIQKQSLVNLSLAIYTEKIELWHIVIVLIPNHILRCWMHDHHCQGSADECQTSLQAGAASGAPGNLQHLHDFLTTTFHFGLARDASSISTFRSDQRLLDFQTFGRLWMTS